ncbi:MAG: alpha-mannosidase [Clostridiales bacterium]|nr:alpha-mannosidase [Clostridiales bacterium]
MGRFKDRILNKQIDLVKGAACLRKIPITGWKTMEQRFEFPEVYTTTEDWRDISVGDTWKCAMNVTRRFKATATIPAPEQGGRIVGAFIIGGESLIRVNGEVYGAVTGYRDGTMLSKWVRCRVEFDKFKPGDTIEIEFESCLNFLDSRYVSANDNGEFDYETYTFAMAEFQEIDDEIESYAFDITNLFEVSRFIVNPMAQHIRECPTQGNHMMGDVVRMSSEEYYHSDRLIKAVEESLSKLELHFGTDALKASIPQAKAVIDNVLSGIPHKTNTVIKLVGNSHIDTAWLWPLKESVRKCAKTLSAVLALMDKYPDFIFAASQPQLWRFTEQYYPDLFEKAKKRIAEGRIELVGNAWVEMDTNIPSGESLVRQLLYGRAYYRSRFGKDSKVFWMPDVFGYSWAMPQIIKRSGVDYFFTAKLNNNDTNRFPHSLFLWQGIDGTKIPAYLQRVGYNGEIEAELIDLLYRFYDQRALTDSALLTYGHGDGGGGPTYQMFENFERLKKNPAMPHIEHSTAQAFFEGIEEFTDELPVWNDEMYYEFHRGTYTSQANTKKNNRLSELRLREAEIASAMATVYTGAEYPAEKLARIWEEVLTNQFHDIMPGSSVHDVYVDADKSYVKILAEAKKIYEKAISRLNALIPTKEGEVIVWNFLSKARSGIVSVGDKEFYAESVPPMGYKVFNPEASMPQGSVSADIHCLENANLRVSLNDNGLITSVYDKRAKREVLKEGTTGNLLTVFDDSPHGESAWNIDPEYQNKFWELTDADSVEVVESSPLKGVIRVVRSFNKSKITQDITLNADADRIDFITTVDWYETEKMLKAAFNVDIHATKATYEIQFGSIERPTHRNTTYDRARFEVSGHKWCDLSENEYGVSILNDCKYGWDVKDSNMRITLLRAPNFPDVVADKGVHTFTYSLYPHENNWRQGGTVEEAFDLNVKLLPYECKENTPKAELYTESFVTVDADGVMIDTIKGAEDGNGIIFRMYEAKGGRYNNAELKFAFPVASVNECNLMEDNEDDYAVENNAISFKIKPYEIKTFRVIPK